MLILLYVVQKAENCIQISVSTSSRFTAERAEAPKHGWARPLSMIGWVSATYASPGAAGCRSTDKKKQINEK